MSILKRDLSGEPVHRLQQALGIEADGIFGAGTEAAVRDYQKMNDLAVDGFATGAFPFSGSADRLYAQASHPWRMIVNSP